MIRIKAVDAQNMLDVCELTANQDGIGTGINGCSWCNAIFLAEAKFDAEMHPNAIYNNNVLIGFFMYQRPENQADTATICRFMIDYQFQHKGLGKKAFEYVLRGLKIQGVKKVVLIIDNTNENNKNLYLSFGFHFARKIEKAKYCYELEL